MSNEAVKYNEDAIKTLSGLQHVRRHPGMYGFDLSSQQAQYQCLKEIVDNSYDEATIDPRHKHTIKIIFAKSKQGYQCIIQDMGRGIPLAALSASFTVMNTSGKDSDSYQSSVGTFGVGIKATSGLSKHMCAVSHRAEGTAKVVVSEGKTTAELICIGDVRDNTTGMTVIFEPDTKLMSGVNKFFEPEGGYFDMLGLIDFLTTFTDNVCFEVSETKNYIDYKSLETGTPIDILDTVADLKLKTVYKTDMKQLPSDYMVKLFNITSPVLWKSDRIVKKLGDNNVGYDIQFFLTEDHKHRNPALLSSINMTRIHPVTASQTHGLLVCMKRHLEPYIDNAEIKSFFNTLYKLPFHISVMAKCDGATFLNQSKDNFKDVDFLRRYTRALNSRFTSFGDDYWKKLFGLMVEDLEHKFHKHENKGIKLGISMANMAFNLNNHKAFDACKSTDKRVTEIFITEGMSAGGWVKQLRNVDTQAVFKLKGKPLNGVRAENHVLNKNEVYQDLKQVLGTTITDKDLEDLNFNRLILLSDADSHGYHISTLILTLLHRINPEIIRQGKVVLANPPLYVMAHKKTSLFLKDMNALMDCRVTTYSDTMELRVQVGDGEKRLLEGSAFRDIVYLLTHVGRILSNVANKLAITPGELELMCHCVEFIDSDIIDTASIKRTLNLDDCVYQKASNSLILVVGGVEIVIPLDNLASEIKAFIMPELRKMHWEHISLYVTTTQVDLYQEHPVTVAQLYDLFMTVDKTFQVHRMKGLGEMEPAALFETCIDPLTRSFIVIKDVGDLDRIYAIMGNDTKARKSLMVNTFGNE